MAFSRVTLAHLSGAAGPTTVLTTVQANHPGQRELGPPRAGSIAELARLARSGLIIGGSWVRSPAGPPSAFSTSIELGWRVSAHILGHTSLAMIQNVYSHLTPSDAYEAMVRTLAEDDVPATA